MLVELLREARDEPRDGRQRAGRAVAQVVIVRADRPRVLRPAAPEHHHVLDIAVQDIVEAAAVVDLPRDPGLVEEVEDDRPLTGVDDPEAAVADARDAAGGAGHQVEAVWRARAEDRAEV